MKIMLVFICLSFILFSCGNFPSNAKPSIIVNQDTVIVRASPNINSFQLFKYNENQIMGAYIEGVSSNKDKMVIGGKEYNEHWYLIEVRFRYRNGIKERLQGWVYGGYIEFTEDLIKPSFLPISDRDLEKKEVYFTLCNVSYHVGGEDFSQNSCVKGDGMIRFYANNRFIRYVSKDPTIEYWTGTYSIENNTLILVFEPKYILISYDKAGRGTRINKINPIKLIKKYGVHNIQERPIFIALPNYKEEYTTWTRPSIQPSSENHNNLFEDAEKEFSINNN